MPCVCARVLRDTCMYVYSALYNIIYLIIYVCMHSRWSEDYPKCSNASLKSGRHVVDSFVWQIDFFDHRVPNTALLRTFFEYLSTHVYVCTRSFKIVIITVIDSGSVSNTSSIARKVKHALLLLYQSSVDFKNFKKLKSSVQFWHLLRSFVHRYQ